MAAVKPQVPKGEPEAASAGEARRGGGARRRRLADIDASLWDEVLAASKHRAEEALAADGVDRTRLGYEVLVKIKMDDLLERGFLPTAVEDDRASLVGAAVGSRTGEASVIGMSGTRRA